MGYLFDENVSLRVADGVMACELGDGLALLHQASGTFYVLGELESFIWKRSAAPVTPVEIANAVMSAYEAPPAEVDRDVSRFVKSMIDAGLFEIDETVSA